jgi:hypothetical protein
MSSCKESFDSWECKLIQASCWAVGLGVKSASQQKAIICGLPLGVHAVGLACHPPSCKSQTIRVRLCMCTPAWFSGTPDCIRPVRISDAASIYEPFLNRGSRIAQEKETCLTFYCISRIIVNKELKGRWGICFVTWQCPWYLSRFYYYRIFFL